ncbi:MAG: 1-acyl-sn-glycerol-3-phosphate acyltransferase [Verrucomicrobia bacterium]|nr:MAG: 1-acyl-sn-glycerol-3-phosphate acyltransferase [Verrucomicrobiota bacterium]
MGTFPPEIAAAARPGKLYRGSRVFVRWLFAAYFRWRIHHADNVPAVGPVILASNHVSFADPVLVGSALDRAVHYLARKSLFENPFFGALIRRYNALPVDRDGGGGAGLKAIIDRLDHGAAILLFPEGTRSQDGQPGSAKAGIGLIAIKSDVPVAPVRIFGAFESWGRHRRLPAPRRIDVVFGPPLDLSALRVEAKTCDRVRLKAIYQEAADAIMRAIGSIELPR